MRKTTQDKSMGRTVGLQISLLWGALVTLGGLTACDPFKPTTPPTAVADPCRQVAEVSQLGGAWTIEGAGERS